MVERQHRQPAKRVGPAPCQTAGAPELRINGKQAFGPGRGVEIPRHQGQPARLRQMARFLDQGLVPELRVGWGDLGFLAKAESFEKNNF